MPKENNKMQVDIDTLKKQNVNDLLSIKELYKRIEELGEKITQVKYIDNTLVKKIKKEYENLKKIILDENVQVQLVKKIDDFNLKLTHDIETINSQMDNNTIKVADVYNRELNIFTLDNNLNTAIERITDKDITYFIPDGDYTINTINIKDDIKIKVSKNAIFRPISDDITMLEVGNRVSFVGGNFITPASYSGTIIGLGENSVENSYIETTIIGSYNGTALDINCLNGKYAVFNKFKLDIRNTLYGIKLFSDGKGFVNSNDFNCKIWGCATLISVTKSDANNFKFIGQSGYKIPNQDCYGIYCDNSQYNLFDGFIYDVGSSASGKKLTNIYCYFTETTYDNTLTTIPQNNIGLNLKKLCINKGLNNIGNSLDIRGIYYPPCKTEGQYTSEIIGDQDNILAYAHKNDMFTITSNHKGTFFVNNGTYSGNAWFEPNKMVTALYQNTQGDTTASLEYTITINKKINLKCFGLQFTGNNTCDIDLLLYNDTKLVATLTSTKKVNMRSSWNSNVHFSITSDNNIATGVYNKIVVRFYNITGNLFITNMYASSKNFTGNTFLPREGGDVYGNITFVDGSIVMLTPDKSKKYVLTIDNSGALSTTLLE